MNAELAIQELLEQIKERAAASKYSKITAVRLRLGSWENTDADDLVRAFDRLKEGALLENADLFIDKNKTLARCRCCGNTFEVNYLKSRCRHCGSNYMEFIGDRGISLEGIDGVE